MKDQGPSVAAVASFAPVARFALGLTVATALALTALSLAQAKEPDIRIDQLVCTGDPELVVVKNRGSEAQGLTGWKLLSDPTASQSFGLSDAGIILPGGSIFIQSGPSASGAFVWSKDFVFRDSDVADFARLVDKDGNVVNQVNCTGAAATPSPSPTPAPSPPPAPTPSPVAGVPDGGGPPPVPGGAVSPATLIALGSWLASGGLITLALPWLRLPFRRRPTPGAANSKTRPASSSLPPAPARRSPTVSSRSALVAVLAIAALLAVALLLLGWRRSSH